MRALRQWPCSLKTSVGAGLFVLFAVAAACNTSPIKMSLFPDLQCAGSPPAYGIDGTWGGSLSGRELVITLKTECSALNFQAFWLEQGTWAWGGLSSGTALYYPPEISLAGGWVDTTYHGLSIAIAEIPVRGTTINGVATGDLPLSASLRGPWQHMTNEPVVLERR